MPRTTSSKAQKSKSNAKNSSKNVEVEFDVTPKDSEQDSEFEVAAKLESPILDEQAAADAARLEERAQWVVSLLNGEYWNSSKGHELDEPGYYAPRWDYFFLDLLEYNELPEDESRELDFVIWIGGRIIDIDDVNPENMAAEWLLWSPLPTGLGKVFSALYTSRILLDMAQSHFHLEEQLGEAFDEIDKGIYTRDEEDDILGNIIKDFYWEATLRFVRKLNIRRDEQQGSSNQSGFQTELDYWAVGISCHDAESEGKKLEEIIKSVAANLTDNKKVERIQSYVMPIISDNNKRIESGTDPAEVFGPPLSLFVNARRGKRSN